MEKFKVSHSTVDRNWKQWKSEKELSADKKPKEPRQNNLIVSLLKPLVKQGVKE